MVKNICLCKLNQRDTVLFEENKKRSITRAGSGVKVFICGLTEASIVCVCLVKKRMKGGASRIDCIEVIDRRRHSANTGCFKGEESATPQSPFELLLFIPQSWLMRLWVSILLLDYDLDGLILSLLFG